MTFVSFAQNFEDVMLWRALKGVERGFYIDVGAFSATFDSVTRAFYERGWRGVNVEPNPPCYDELVQHRPRDVNLQQAVSDVAGNAEIYLVPNSGLSSLDKTVARHHESLGWSVIAAEVEVTTLATIWASHVPAGQDVHFLKVDVEGAEEAVLRGNDWVRNRPWIVIVEATKPSSQVDSYHSWEPILTSANYTFAYADGLNRFYVATEQKNLAEAFRYPPNIFDGLIRLREYEAETRAAASEKAGEQLAAQAAAAEAAREQFATQAAAAEEAREQFAAQAAAAEEASEQLAAQAAALKARHSIELASARNDIDALQENVTTLIAKLARAESFIDYVTQRKLLERIFFRYDGRPVRPLRRLLFHTSGKPRRLFRRIVLHKDGTPRKAFARWAQNQTGPARNSVEQAAYLTAPRDGPSAEVNRAAEVIRDLDFRPAARPTSAVLRFARGVEKKLIRPIISPVPNHLRSFLVDGLSDQIHQLDQRMEGQSSSRREVTAEMRDRFSEMHDNFSKMRDNFAEMQREVLSEMHLLTVEAEKTLLTLAMERGPDAWLAAVPAPAERAPKPVRVPLILPGGRITEVECASADLSVGASLVTAGGDWEPHVRSFLQTVVKPDWVCLDIGANLGAHTLSLAVLAHEGKVVAFEADPANYALLRRNAAALDAPKGHIDPIHAAIWDSAGTLVIGGADELAGCSFVADGAADPAKTEQRLRAVVDRSAISGTMLHLRLSDVIAVPLDDWVAANPLPRLDMIKLDVEGAEARVVRGADRTIREYRPILVVEYDPACAEAYFAQPADALFNELEPRFASIHALENDGSLTRLSGWRALGDRLKTGKGWEDLVCFPEPCAAARSHQPRT